MGTAPKGCFSHYAFVIIIGTNNFIKIVWVAGSCPEKSLVNRKLYPEIETPSCSNVKNIFLKEINPPRISSSTDESSM